jgi:cytochrome c5
MSGSAVAVVSIALGLGAATCLTVRAQPPAAPVRGAPWLAAHAAGSPLQSVWDSVYTNEQAKRGELVYRRTCARCHGDVLSGGELATPLTGSSFLANWNGLTVGDLFERIRVSMPADNPGSLTGQQIADVLAHTLRFNGFPAGRKELDRRAELLKEIRIETQRP